MVSSESGGVNAAVINYQLAVNLTGILGQIGRILPEGGWPEP